MSLKTRLKRLEADRRPETEADEHEEIRRLHHLMHSDPELIEELRDAAEYEQEHGEQMPCPRLERFRQEHGLS